MKLLIVELRPLSCYKFYAVILNNFINFAVDVLADKKIRLTKIWICKPLGEYSNL